MSTRSSQRGLVGVVRLELATSRPPAVRATNCATPRYLYYSTFPLKTKGFDPARMSGRALTVDLIGGAAVGFDPPWQQTEFLSVHQVLLDTKDWPRQGGANP